MLSSERRSRSAVTIGICKIITHFLSPSRRGLRKRQPYGFHLLLRLLSLDEKRGQSKHFIRVGTRNVHCSLRLQFYYLFLLGGEAFASLQRYSFCRAVCVLVTSGIPSLAGGVILRYSAAASPATESYKSAGGRGRHHLLLIVVGRICPTTMKLNKKSYFAGGKQCMTGEVIM